ncbi:MAG: DUF4091 domain-containing protein, partial [Planctomycetota bacterium]|nr:DUF4091 domain-containing protein [Planctomycetota bacterium]
GYGWRRKELVCEFPRTSFAAAGAVQLLHHAYLTWERNITAQQRGVGRLIGDLTWPAMKDSKGQLRSISGRYPESHKGQLNVRMNPYLAPGPDGAVSTVRLEMVREGLQECEARIFIEDALLDPARKAKLGDELAARCQKILDARYRDIQAGLALDGPMAFCHRRVERNAELFNLAAEVAAKLGK